MKAAHGALVALGISSALAAPAFAQDTCPHRGDLDSSYCDANHDLVADTPTDPAKLKSPSTLVFTFTPVEDPAVYEKIFRNFTEHLSSCVNRRVVFFQVQSNAAEIEAMRAGRLHVGSFSTGPTAFAVNIAGAVPFALKGSDKGFTANHVIMIVRKDSPYQKLTDLKGKRVAHVAPSSNSGHMAPLALFPKEGLTPEKDYKLVFSGKHDQSILGVANGDYDAAAVADDVFRRMAERGVIKSEDFRVLYQSPKFPTSAFAHAHHLEPAFRDQMKRRFLNYRFKPRMQKAFDADRFVPVSYEKDWAVVREVASASGEKFNRAAYERSPKK